jgi:hypothetical protein
LRALRAEATGAEQAPHVIRVVDDREVLPDQVDEAATRPQAGAVAGGFRPGDDHARKAAALGGAQLRRAAGGWPGAQSSAALSSVGSLPAANGTPIDAEAVRHHMHGDLSLQQCDRTEASPLQFRRAPLWAHVVPPTVEHTALGH